MAEEGQLDAPPREGTRYVAGSDHPLLRPRDAASIILLDRSGPAVRFLVGKRGRAHVFMPNVYVFPGGRRDPADSSVPVASEFRRDVMDKLLLRSGARMTPRKARALGVTAIRETHEEAGLLIGRPGTICSHPDWTTFAAQALAPDLRHLRYVARAITPPRQSRRFDTRFFACFLDEVGVAADAVRDSDELHDLTWLGLDELQHRKLPRITQAVLEEVRRELRNDHSLPFGRPVPFFHVRSGYFVRDVI
jgi:8-oxo-dGTP pyrophosphatase MutT (NUDIX family)